MSYPRFVASRNHKKVTRATGTDLSLTSTAVAELAAATNGPGSGGFDITLAAQVGDEIGYFLGFMSGSQAHTVGFDVYTMVSGSQVNPFGVGLSASLASTLGYIPWRLTGAAQELNVGAWAFRTLVSGDLASGAVLLRPYYAKANATARTIYSSANTGPLVMMAVNLGPPDPN